MRHLRIFPWRHQEPVHYDDGMANISYLIAILTSTVFPALVVIALGGIWFELSRIRRRDRG